MIDYNSAEFKAALAIAQKQKPRNVTDIQAAEIMLLSKNMLWYTQARLWAQEPPEWAPATWGPACRALVQIVDRGYDRDHNTWWYMGDMDQAELAAAMMLLMDLGLMIKAANQQTLHVISATFLVIIDIICGHSWERRYLNFLKTIADKKGAA